VVILDDLDVADLDTTRLLRHVIRTTTSSPVLILCVYREPATRRSGSSPLDQLLADLRVERPYHRYRLHGLGEDDVGALLGDRPRVRAGASGVRAITRRTRGNPFYIEIARRLLVDAWMAADQPVGRGSDPPPQAPGSAARTDFGGTAAQTDAAGAGAGPDDDLVPGSHSLRLPKRREELLDRRIAHRSPDAAAVLRILSALPGPAGRDLLGPVSELAAERILDGLDELVRAGLVAVGGTGVAPAWQVAHPLIREAFEGRWTVARKAHLHRRVAQAMERSAAGREREIAAVLGWHYQASAAIPGADRGLRYLLLAAEAASGVYAHVRAATLLRMALAVVRKDDLAIRADVLGRLAQAEADAMVPEARQRAEAAATAMAEARRPVAEIAALLADVARALRRGGAPLETWRPLADRTLSHALLRGERGRQWARMTALADPVVPLMDGPDIHAGRWQGHDPAALAILEASNVEDDRADALHALDLRTRSETHALLTSASRWRRPAAAMHALAVALRDLVDRHGDYAEAAAVATNLIELARHHGALRTEVAALLDLALCELVLGEGESADRTIRTARRRAGTLDGTIDLGTRILRVALVRAGYEDRDWHHLGRLTARRVADPASIADPSILPLAAWAALAPVRLARAEMARDRLPQVIELLARTSPETPGHLEAVVVAATTAWELGAVDHATTLRTLAAELMEHGASVQ
nr:hypothetical protein [Chloroflexota bacterium]